MKFAREITEQDKADFIELLKDGYDPGSAARQLGSTGTQFRKLRRAHTQWFDPAFADACAAAESDEARAVTRRERLEEAFWEAVENGERWAVEKGLYAYHPDFEHLRHTNLRVSGEVEHTWRAMLPHLTDEELRERLIEAGLADPPGKPVALIEGPKAA